jgi:hypothetical protein
VDAKVDGGDGHQEITGQRSSPLCHLGVNKVASEGVKSWGKSQNSKKKTPL